MAVKPIEKIMQPAPELISNSFGETRESLIVRSALYFVYLWWNVVISL